MIKYCMSLIRCSFKWAYDTIANANFAMKKNSKLNMGEIAYNIFSDARDSIASALRKDPLK